MEGGDKLLKVKVTTHESNVASRSSLNDKVISELFIWVKVIYEMLFWTDILKKIILDLHRNQH